MNLKKCGRKKYCFKTNGKPHDYYRLIHVISRFSTSRFECTIFLLPTFILGK